MTGVPSPTIDARDTEAPVTRGLLSSQRRIRAWLNAAVDLIFPPRCAGCGRVDTSWCGRCQQALDVIPIWHDVREAPPMSAVASTGLHRGKLRAAVHALKYENGRALAVPLAARMAACLHDMDWTFDTLVPVPLHTSRQSSRGYNQSQLLVEQLANRLVIPYSFSALTRQRDTRQQVGLTAVQRLANMKDAFTANPSAVYQRRLLLVDDVYTTGATLGACAAAALEGGADAVYALTVTAANQLLAF
jgi:ComF family protein